MIVTWSKPLAQGQFVLVVVVDGNVEAHNKRKTAKSLSARPSGSTQNDEERLQHEATDEPEDACTQVSSVNWSMKIR